MKKIIRSITDFRGDTIVEVLLTLTVLGLAFSISYSTSNHSLQAIRTAQENAEATSYLNTEIEELRTLAPDPNNQIYNQASYFCIDTTTNAIIPVTATNPSQLTTLDSTVYPNECIQPNTNPLYYIAISQPDPNNTFTLYAHWYSIQGQVEDSVTLNYRIHPIPGSVTKDASGTASLDGKDSGCAFKPCHGKNTPGATYHWTQNLINNTDPSEAALIVGCLWNFHDGTKISGVSCAPNATISHPYTPPVGWPAVYDPSLCKTVPETVTLTLNLSNGSDPVDSHTFYLPACW